MISDLGFLSRAQRSLVFSVGCVIGVCTCAFALTFTLGVSLSHCPPYSLRWSPSVSLKLVCLSRLAGSELQVSACFCPPSNPALGLQGCAAMPSFHMDSVDPSSGPYAASALLPTDCAALKTLMWHQSAWCPSALLHGCC